MELEQFKSVYNESVLYIYIYIYYIHLLEKLDLFRACLVHIKKHHHRFCCQKITVNLFRVFIPTLQTSLKFESVPPLQFFLKFEQRRKQGGESVKCQKENNPNKIQITTLIRVHHTL